MNPWQYIVQESDETYCCIICGCGNMNPIPVNCHVNGKRHCEALEQYSDDIAFQGNNNYYCNLCKCHVSGYENVYDHLMGQRHQDFLNGLDSETSYESSNCDGIEPWNYIVKIHDTKYYCFICGCDIFSYVSADKHANGTRHSKALDDYGSDISRTENNGYHCDLCECPIRSYKNVFKHLIGQRHQDNLNDSS